MYYQKILVVIRLNSYDFTFSLVEHSMYVYQTSKLVLTTRKGNESLFEKYIVFLNEGFFKYFSYRMFYGILIEVSTYQISFYKSNQPMFRFNFQFSALTATFMWQFRDLLIVLLSTALAERFQQLNTAIKTNQVSRVQECQDQNVVAVLAVDSPNIISFPKY